MNISRYTMICLLILPHAAYSWESIVADICPQHGVSPQIAIAVIKQESSGNPYAIGVNMRGLHTGHFPESQQEAYATLYAALMFTTNVGIGLMQINWMVWGEKLGVEPHQLFDERLNIQKGCEILGDALRSSNDIRVGIGRYHSHTPRLRDAYANKIMERLASK